MVNNNMLLPRLFYNFFRSDWDIDHFICHNEAYLRDKAIDHYYDDASENTKYNDIIIMLRRRIIIILSWIKILMIIGIRFRVRVVCTHIISMTET